MTTYQTSSPPDSARANSPTVLLQYRQKDKGSYVQRWKVLRDRNRNLPKLDFNIKATVIPKRQQRNYGIGLTRSYTMDSGTKLPSISTSSVITSASTNITGTSGHKPQGSGKKAVSIQDGVEVHVQDRHPEVNLNPAMSKSLPNIANATQQESTKSPKHRYEKIAHSKRLMKRSHDKESNNTKETQILEQSGIYQIELGEIGDDVVSSGKLSERKILSPVNETNSARTREQLQNDRIGRRSRRQKWRDNCKCMRCEIMKRQFVEGDDHYTKWGIYPCQQFNRQKYFNHYFYDSD